ncbi:hypothetical protein O3P69_006255 [Scylla paramamosain]|uniref:Uncharacterized protein n=1 Tax=Scylla paramamosain TaxID=85552 RepID=A0AAW0U877_SCYPA
MSASKIDEVRNTDACRRASGLFASEAVMHLGGSGSSCAFTRSEMWHKQDRFRQPRRLPKKPPRNFDGQLLRAER